jgi:hypothetical protein
MHTGMTLFIAVLSLVASIAHAQTPADRKLVLMVTANEPMRSDVAKALMTQFASVKGLKTFVFEKDWPVSEPDWSLSVIVNEVITSDGTPTGSYVMSTAYLKQINLVDTARVEQDLKNFRCAEEPLRLNAYRKSMVPKSEFLGQAISTGTLKEGYEANVKEIVSTFTERFLNPALEAQKKPANDEPWRALQDRPKIPLPRRP